MKLQKLCAALVAAFGCVYSALAVTTGTVPSDGVYKFSFGSSYKPDGYTHVEATDVYDASHQYADTTPGSGTYTYGFLGTTKTSYKDDVPWSLKAVARAIDGFSVVQGQYIALREEEKGVAGPLKENYLPAGASAYEGRYPVRFSFSAEQGAYYAVTCTVVNVSSTEEADVTLFSERCHMHAHHLKLAAGAKRTFAWSVELFPNVFKTEGTYTDDAINIAVVGVNAGLQSVIAVKQPQKAGTIRGEATDKMNVGKTMWLCDDSTGTDQANATPYFSLQNYSGVGSGISRWAPANLAIRNQGEGGLATNDQAHRKSCQLKPGDYLYVEYGHNDKADASFTNNLEVYLSDATAAGANLIIVSPVERRSGWSDADQTFHRSLQWYAEAGEAWVTNKINAGVRNIAFIDLNKRYNTWQNEEIGRINTAHPAISRNAAINYYYRSAKGANVDNTHINNAGSDQAAYWVWYDALARVEAGKNAAEGTPEKVQADVLAGITEGYQGYVGDSTTEVNEPWLVTDDIIADGAAPNSFWDTPVTADLAYVNDADIAGIDATANEDGSVTLSGITMRILNPGNYYKSVIDVVSADGATTNRYYSYYNYDVGGISATTGTLITPNEPGFLDTDADMNVCTKADRQTIEIPADGKAYVWFAKVDDSTRQVGTNGPCSVKYPIEWWSQIVADETCATADKWNVLSQAVWTTNIVEDALYCTSTGANAANTKKNFGIYRALDANVEGGRYRISFRAMIDAGSISYSLGDAIGTSTSYFKNSVNLLTLTTSSVSGYQKTAPLVTFATADDGTKTPQARMNTSRWADVDMIIDRDNARAWVSVGGSAYVEWKDSSFLPGSFSGRTWKYFGLSLPGQTSTYGYVKDVKILKLAPVTYPTITVNAAPSDATLGSVTINGSALNTMKLYSGAEVMLSATAADKNFYKFSGWKNADETTASDKANLYYPALTTDLNLTAAFAKYGDDEYRTLTWDFSNYQGDFAVSGVETNITDQGLSFVMTTGESLTGSGFTWANSANTSTKGAIKYNKCIYYTPTSSGTLSLTFSVDAYTSSRKPTISIYETDTLTAYASGKKIAELSIGAANTTYTLTANLTAGHTYCIFPSSYNWDGGKFYHNYLISKITYTYPPVVTLSVPTVENASVKVTQNGEVLEPDTTGATSTYAVTIGSTVVVTYTSSIPGYIVSNGVITQSNIMADTTIDTTSVKLVEAYTWTGAAGDGLWTSVGNWNHAGTTPAETAPTLGTDTIDFTADATVTIADLYVLTNTAHFTSTDCLVTFKIPTTQTLTGDDVCINANVGISGDFNVKTNFTGTGKLTLVNCSFLNESSRTVKFSNALDIPADSVVSLSMTGSNSSRFIFSAAVTGSGKISSTTGGSASYAGVQFSGDMSSFKGTADISVGKGNALTRFQDSALDMSASSWNVFTNGTAGANAFPFGVSGGTFKFGSLNMVIPDCSSGNSAESKFTGCWIEVGAHDQDSSLSGGFNNASHKESIRWIAPTATLKLTTSNIYQLKVTGGGEVDFSGATTGVPSDSIIVSGKGAFIKYDATSYASVTNKLTVSSAPLGFDVPAEATCTFDASLLTGSTISYLMKKGEGTLSVPENTLFTNALTYTEQKMITITDLPEGKRVALVTDETTGCLKATIADGFTDVTIEVAEDATDIRTNAVATGASSLIKTGAGTLVLADGNSFEGSVTLSAGTLKLGGASSLAGTQFDYDASLANKIETDENGALVAWRDVLGKSADLAPVDDTTAPVLTKNDSDKMNGKPVFWGNTLQIGTTSSLKLNSFVVVGQTKTWSRYGSLMTDKDNYRINLKNDNNWHYKTSANAGYSDATGLYINGVHTGGAITTPMVAVISNRFTKAETTTMAFGASSSSDTQGFSELMAFDHVLSSAEVAWLTDYLMRKWGLAEGSINPLPTSAELTVAAGATLDLGTWLPTVYAATFANGATLAFDSLPSDGVVLTATQALVVNGTLNLVIGGSSVEGFDVTVEEIEDGYQLKIARPTATENVAAGVTKAVTTTYSPYLASLTKRGEGTLTLDCVNDFSGPVNIEEGTLKLGSLSDVSDVRFHYDFADPSTYEGKVSAVTSYTTGDKDAYTYTGVTPWTTNDLNVLNGHTALASTSFLMKTDDTVIPKNSGGTTFAVAQYLTNTKSGRFIGDWSDAYYNERWYWSVASNKMNWHPNGSSTVYGRINGVESGTVEGATPFVFSTTQTSWRTDKNDARCLSFGGSAAMAWGEVLNYSRVLTSDEITFVEAMLMERWDIEKAELIPAAASVSVSGGATLDLAGLKPTVASLTLEPGATLNVDSAAEGDTILTADELEVGDNVTLTINGVANPSYYLVVDEDNNALKIGYHHGLMFIFQ